jgi:hypothetical protein
LVSIGGTRLAGIVADCQSPKEDDGDPKEGVLKKDDAHFSNLPQTHVKIVCRDG